MSRLSAPGRDQFKSFVAMPTRWADNDIYGHVNNVTYFSYFDTAVNQWLIAHGLLNVGIESKRIDTIAHESNNAPLGLVVSNQCQFYASVAFPQALEVGLRVERLGHSSVTYGLGVFAIDSSVSAAYGQFTHVYVDRNTRKPVELPALWRNKLAQLMVLV